jgi:hypothetical protein
VHRVRRLDRRVHVGFDVAALDVCILVWNVRDSDTSNAVVLAGLDAVREACRSEGLGVAAAVVEVADLHPFGAVCGSVHRSVVGRAIGCVYFASCGYVA